MANESKGRSVGKSRGWSMTASVGHGKDGESLTFSRSVQIGCVIVDPHSEAMKEFLDWLNDDGFTDGAGI